VHGQTERSFGVGRSYGLTDGPGPVLQTISDVLGLYEAGIAECARVLVPGAASSASGHDHVLADRGAGTGRPPAPRGTLLRGPAGRAPVRPL
jgi:hypothetical protein